MAGAGYKLFNTGDVLTAAQVNTYLQEQVVMVFADSTARTTALSSVLAEGMISYLKSDDTIYVYNGSSWVAVGGDQIPLTTKGDLLTFSTVDARLPVGSNNQTLLADSAQTTGLKWAPSATSTLTTKGDLLGASATNTLARIAVGTDGQVLTADAASTAGVKWTTISSSPTYVGCRLYNTTGTNPSCSNDAVTTITFNNETFDTDGFHSTTTNTSRITIPSGKAGYYRVTAHLFMQAPTNETSEYQLRINKNGTLSSYLVWGPGDDAADTGTSINDVFNLAVGDYVEMAVYQNSGSTRTVTGSEIRTHFEATFIGA